MASFNKVILMGNLTKDPEVRYTSSGTAVCDLRMAVNRKFKTTDGQYQDEVCFVGITVWSKQAESCGEYLGKGSQVMVEGRLKLDEWEKDGQKHSRLGVVAERVQFLGSPRNAEFQDDHKSSVKKEGVPAEERGHTSNIKAESSTPNESGEDDNLPF